MLAFLRANARWIAGGFLLTTFSSFGQTFFIGLSGNELRARFDLSGGAFGGIYMVATLASAALLPWLGRTLDMMPGWKVVRFVMPCLAGACLMIAFASHLTVLLVALFLLRLFGQGMMTQIAYTEIGRWFVASRGRAVSLVVPGHQAGEAVLPLLFVLVGGAFGWRAAWIASAAAILLVGYPAILALLRTDRVPAHRIDPVGGAPAVRDWTRREVVRDPVFYLLNVGVLAPPFIGTTIFFHQGYLIDLRGYDPLAFASAFTVMAATTVAFALVGGALIDRFSATRLMPFALVPLLAATLAAALVTPVWGIYLFMFLFGISYGFTSTLLGALWPEVYGLAHLGSIRALTVSAMVLATAAGPGITGALIDAGVGLPRQLLWMALWCIAASFALGLARRRIAARQPSGGRQPR